MQVADRLGISPLGPCHWLMYGRSMYFDLAHTTAALGWSARFGNIEMLCESYDWYLQHRDEVLHPQGAASRHRSRVRQGVLALVSRALSLYPSG